MAHGVSRVPDGSVPVVGRVPSPVRHLTDTLSPGERAGGEAEAVAAWLKPCPFAPGNGPMQGRFRNRPRAAEVLTTKTLRHKACC